MADFTLEVTKGGKVDQIENLKSTSTVKEMVRQIKRKYKVSDYGAFSLLNRFGEELYFDDENNDSNETLESFFGNCNRSEIIYDLIKAGNCHGGSSKNSIVIWNALKQQVKCFYKYKIDNVFQTDQHHTVNIGGNVEVATVGGGGNLGLERTIKQEKVGPDNKSGEFDITPRGFVEVPFEDQAIKGAVADCTIVIEEGQKIEFSAKKGKAFIIFKDGHTPRNDPPKFVLETSDYCRKPEKFDWKTQTGKDLSNNVERPPRHNKK